MHEIELKVHIGNPSEVQKKLEAAGCVFEKEYKSDIYYSKPNGPALFRLRQEGDEVFVTYKHKHVANGVEMNRETEYTVSSDQFSEVETFFTDLGYVEFIRKTKSGVHTHLPLKTLPPVHIEIVEIEPLGWFVEMEILLESESRASQASEVLKSLLGKLDIPLTAIEEQYYMDLLKQAKREKECKEQMKKISDTGSLVIYTDGGCHGNPGPGGWAYVVEGGVESSGGDEHTTNNRMELQAVIQALTFAISADAGHVDLYTDSQYVKNGITSWVHNWKRKGWMTAGKKPVKNKEYWVELDALASRISVDFHWVKGHAGVELNERCDSLVQQAIAQFE